MSLNRDPIKAQPTGAADNVLPAEPETAKQPLFEPDFEVHSDLAAAGLFSLIDDEDSAE